MYQYRPDEIAEHTDSLAYYRIFNIWLAQFKKSTNSCEMAYRNKRHQGDDGVKTIIPATRVTGMRERVKENGLRHKCHAKGPYAIIFRYGVRCGGGCIAITRRRHATP